MLQIEKKLIDFINKYMVHIGIFLVVLFALGIRFAGRKYTGHDILYTLTEIPGNYNSWLHRSFANALGNVTGTALFVIKFIAYMGDAGICLLTCIILRQKGLLKDALHLFLAITAMMLSPVLLESSVAGAGWDSVSICLLLLAYMAYEKQWYLVVASGVALAALATPIYWLAVVAVLVCSVYVPLKRKRQMGWDYYVGAGLLLLFFIGGMLVEGATGCGILYTGAGDFLFSLFRAVGPSMATFLLIVSFAKPKYRIAALIVQTIVLVTVGYWQTYDTVVWLRT